MPNQHRGKSHYNWKGGKITVKCLTCKKLFKAFNCHIIRGLAKNCSKKCSNEYKKIKIVSTETRLKISIKLKGKIPKNLLDIQKLASQRLTGRTGEKSNHWTGGKPKCIDCGKELSYNKTRCVLHSNKNKSGENHYNWQGGITPSYLKLRNSIEYKNWRETVFKRDNWTCQMCKVRGGKVQADHIKPFSLYPSLSLDIDNGRTLCVACHKTTDTFAGKIFTLRKTKNINYQSFLTI